MTTENILAPVASLSVPDAAGLTDRAQTALTFIKSFTIACADDYTLAADELKAIKARATALEEQRTNITGPINKALKAVNDLFRGPASLLDEAERTIKGKMIAWDQEQKRIADEARQKAEAEAAAERKRLAELAAEQKRIADEQAAAAAKAQAAGDAQAAALATAAAARAHAQAAAATDTAQLVVAAPAIAAPVKAKGISTSTKIDFEVQSITKLVAFIALGDGEKPLAHPQLVALLGEGDTVKIRAYVKGLGVACRLPGVRVFESEVMSARAA